MTKSACFKGFVLVLMLSMALTGCSLRYSVEDPVLSSVDYSADGIQPLTMTIVDRRTGDDAVFLVKYFGPGGSSSDALSLELENLKDPIAYFTQELEQELNARQIPVNCVVGQAAGEGPTLLVHRYQIVNIRATGFSPYEACHIFAGTLLVNGREKTIKAYFYNGKMPVWSMDEVEKPCFTIPVSIMIKDVASKINAAAFDLRAPDGKIAELTGIIDTQAPGAGQDPYERPFWQVLELGYTNNPLAMEPLKKYAQDADEFFGSCALSAMGTLGAQGQLDFLVRRYQAGGYNNRYMAAKAIGDIGTEEAIQVLRGFKKSDAYAYEGGLKHCLDLYAP